MPATAPLESPGGCVSEDEDDVEDDDVGFMTAVTVATDPLLSVFVATKVLGEPVNVDFLVVVVSAVLAVRIFEPDRRPSLTVRKTAGLTHAFVARIEYVKCVRDLTCAGVIKELAVSIAENCR